MWILIISLLCELMIGTWLSWYMFVSEHKVAGVITSLFTIIAILISYKVFF